LAAAKRQAGKNDFAKDNLWQMNRETPISEAQATPVGGGVPALPPT
jgi:hypothetical protein